MDIFTTQLTRVVPVPIKPASLKVKALLKEAANSKLTKDPNHLENHEYYFNAIKDEYHTGQQEIEPEPQYEATGDIIAEQSEDETSNEKTDTASFTESNIENKEEDNNKDSKHLDLYA